MSLWEDIVRDKMLDLLCVVTGEKNSPTAANFYANIHQISHFN
jgi:hypothetical protein